jgi:hypothetical protein
MDTRWVMSTGRVVEGRFVEIIRGEEGGGKMEGVIVKDLFWAGRDGVMQNGGCASAGEEDEKGRKGG